MNVKSSKRKRVAPIRATITETELKAILWVVKQFTSNGYTGCGGNRWLPPALKRLELKLTSTFHNILNKKEEVKNGRTN